MCTCCTIFTCPYIKWWKALKRCDQSIKTPQECSGWQKRCPCPRGEGCGAYLKILVIFSSFDYFWHNFSQFCSHGTLILGHWTGGMGHLFSDGGSTVVSSHTSVCILCKNSMAKTVRVMIVVTKGCSEVWVQTGDMMYLNIAFYRIHLSDGGDVVFGQVLSRHSNADSVCFLLPMTLTLHRTGQL